VEASMAIGNCEERRLIEKPILAVAAELGLATGHGDTPEDMIREMIRHAADIAVRAAWPPELSPRVIAACVGGGITCDMITGTYRLLRAAIDLHGRGASSPSL